MALGPKSSPEKDAIAIAVLEREIDSAIEASDGPMVAIQLQTWPARNVQARIIDMYLKAGWTNVTFGGDPRNGIWVQLIRTEKRPPEKGYDPAGPNSGHGWVFPRPDGMKARCGGPNICLMCKADLARREQSSSPGR